MKKQLKAPYNIAAYDKSGRLVEWTYDTHQSAWRFWRKMKETMEFPDTGAAVKSATFRDNSCELDAIKGTADVLPFRR